MLSKLLNRFRKSPPPPTLRELRIKLSDHIEDFENLTFMLSQVPEFELTMQQAKYMRTAHFNLFSLRDEIWIAEKQQNKAIKRS